MCFGQNLLASFFPLCWWGQVFFRFTWSDYLACFCYVLLKCPVWYYQGNVGDPNCTLGEQESGLSCHFASLLFPVAHHNPSLTKCSQNMVTGDNRCSKETILCSLAMPRCFGVMQWEAGPQWSQLTEGSRQDSAAGRRRKREEGEEEGKVLSQQHEWIGTGKGTHDGERDEALHVSIVKATLETYFKT